MNSLFDLQGRRALVTGSSRGIGAAIALGLAQAGADVVVHAAGNCQKANEMAATIGGMGRRAAVVMADLADPDGPAALIGQSVEALGGLDIFVSNASIQMPEDWSTVNRERFDRQVLVNWRSVLEMIQLAAPPMLERGWGRILTIGSVQETQPHREMVVYAATKCAQTSMVRNLAVQFAPRGVTVNNLAPGVFPTDRNRDRLADPQVQEKVIGWIPAGRFGKPEECAGAALLLCSEAGSYITGQTIYVDGGMSL